mmetsp:Transcript_29014/g.61316  ORF Transcript_29014/g.61316 Transcript_29014/m.61316 type:complete len:370 (-) Transcript_29014:164-1273(-)
MYWFGVKLEDAIEIEKTYKEDKLNSICVSESYGDEDSNDSGSIVIASNANYEESSIEQDADDFVSVLTSYESDTDDSEYSSDESHEVSFLSPCRTPVKKSRVGVIKKVVTKLFKSADSPVKNNSLEENAIHEAASSFILSGFDDQPRKRNPCEPLPLASEPELANGDQIVSDESFDDEGILPTDILPPKTVAGAVCLFIVHAIGICGGDKKNKSVNYGWKAVSTVAHLLQGDRDTMAITSAGSANAKALTQILTREDFLDAGTICNQTGQVADKEDPCHTIANGMGHLTTECQQQIHSQAFGTVFNLILLLLLRYDSCHDVQLCKVALITVGIVSGHLSGRIHELLELSESQCVVNDIYLLYAANQEVT